MTLPYVLVLVIATSNLDKAGATSVVVDFYDQKACLVAGQTIHDDAFKRGNYVLTWGCYKR